MTKTKTEYKDIALEPSKEERWEHDLPQFFGGVEQTHNWIRQLVRDLTPDYDVLFVELGSIEEEEDISDDPPYDPEEEEGE